MQYYFLYLSLPELSFQKRPDLSFRELKQLLSANLSPQDRFSVGAVLRLVDLYNMKAIWMGGAFDERGNFTQVELEEALLTKDETLPSYVLDFLSQYEENETRLANFSSLITSLYREKHSGFLEFYYDFERTTRLWFSAIRAKQLKRDLMREMQFEDPYDPNVYLILAQKDSSTITVPSEYAPLQQLWEEHSSDPYQLGQALLAYRWHKVEEVEDTTDFSIDRLLNYLVRFYLVDDWFQRNKEEGLSVVHRLGEYG